MFGERPISDLARELLTNERSHAEDPALKARALERAAAVLAQDRPSGVGLREWATPGAVKSRRVWRTLPLIAASLAAAGLAAAGVGLYHRRVAETSAPVVPPSMAPLVSRAPLQPKVSIPAPREAVPESLPEVRPAPTTPPTDVSRSVNVRQYANEVALLEPARSSLGRGDYVGALAELAKHRREFPNGQLAQEREALRVRALWGSGQKPAALAAATAFRKRYPRSVLLSWMKTEGSEAP